MIARRGALMMIGSAALAPGMAWAKGDAALEAAIAGPQRSEAHRARDPYRHPYESLVFWGVKPGATVIEVSPGSGYWTEILAPYAKATGGTYVATASDLDNPELSERARKSRAAFEAKYADQSVFGAVRYANFGPRSAPLGQPGSADVVITARNLHNWAAQGPMLDKVLADFFAVLKPGGVLGVEEHRSDPRPQGEGAPTGYMETAYVVSAIEKAGFKLDAKSEINANPKDDKDHPFGVWTLPPTRQSAPSGQPANPDFDHGPYDAVGESDRMTLRFVKPA